MELKIAVLAVFFPLSFLTGIQKLGHRKWVRVFWLAGPGSSFAAAFSAVEHNGGWRLSWTLRRDLLVDLEGDIFAVHHDELGSVMSAGEAEREK